MIVETVNTAYAKALSRNAALEVALRPFARLTKVEQARTSIVSTDDLITVVVRVGDIEAARAALSGEEKMDPTMSVGEAYAYRSEDHGPAKKPIR